MTIESPRWFKSTYSDHGGQCVEVATNLATLHGTVAVRDSKDPIGPELSFPADSFGAFIAGVKAGQFGTV
ncbi:DUF397 domain-containing protein [Actinacidiphila bryophytorum]|uniref:DUF397 domain-containing protein n=1 Tax=Actinacidiphila bryophytorum TaxID=1436133 RepID=A0A9W4DZU6_9ACTN|nr:DUF397 domain-containing protein [Actinacidiphila bryophytorum]MBM9439027.1 DUF397 domain-containing protein [Actinacidiphila bryophytorum]MBN6544039.1 DUF397 domain-containing protein [Actinacidiphila bryophytorum]CAG7597575.1 conserved hypothetical protein [Actinacidiphila bryophytorum]